jgi:hypothetical protein
MAELRGQDLDGHLAVQGDMHAAIHGAHATTGEELGDLIPLELCLQDLGARRIPVKRLPGGRLGLEGAA